MKNANDDFQGYVGTEEYHQYKFGTNLSDGALAMAKKYECFWLLDMIVSYKFDYRLTMIPLQCWKFKKVGDGFKVTCDDGNHNILITQEGEHTDMEADKAELWCQRGVIFLPSEY